jgi:hypothetical protein
LAVKLTGEITKNERRLNVRYVPVLIPVIIVESTTPERVSNGFALFRALVSNGFLFGRR